MKKKRKIGILVTSIIVAAGALSAGFFIIRNHANEKAKELESAVRDIESALEEDSEVPDELAVDEPDYFDELIRRWSRSPDFVEDVSDSSPDDDESEEP